MEGPLIGIMVGIALAAASGFRVFVPLLIASLGVRGEFLTVTEGFAWLGSDAAVISFAVATAVEIGAYFIPWLDNALDSLATPAAIVAGTLLSASVMVDLDPWLRWALAIVAGGGSAGLIQGSTVLARAGSSVTTAGLSNPVLSLGEAGGATGLAVIAVAAPFVAFVIVILLLALALRILFNRRRPSRG